MTAHTNAFFCGCDPAAKWLCASYPCCVYGDSRVRHAVEIRTVGSDTVVRSLPASSQRAAETIARGVIRNLNREEYYTEIVTIPAPSEAEP